jgi:hypothetical protein
MEFMDSRFNRYLLGYPVLDIPIQNAMAMPTVDPAYRYDNILDYPRTAGYDFPFGWKGPWPWENKEEEEAPKKDPGGELWPFPRPFPEIPETLNKNPDQFPIGGFLIIVAAALGVYYITKRF